MRSLAVATAVLAALLLVTGCTGSDGADGGSTEETPGAQVLTSAPEVSLTLVAEVDPVAAAVSASRALFETAPVVVVAQAGDAAGELLGASASVGLGVPLLLEDDGATDDGVTAAVLLTPELVRLGTTAVLLVGAADGNGLAEGGDRDVGRDLVAVPAEPAAVAAATGLDFVDADPVPASDAAAAVAALDPQEPAALRPEDAPGPSPPAPSPSGADPGTVPRLLRGDALESTLVLASGGQESLAGIATARAAGASVWLTGGQTDPRASADVVDALAADDAPEAVLALGADFAAEEGLDWKLETAATGTQLPGGGQLLFPGRLMVALYGNVEGGALGVLGEQDLPAGIQRAEDTAAPYEALVDTTVVPTFDIIASIASAGAGPDGNYSAETDPEVLAPWIEAAGEAGVYVVLDLQPGRTDFLTQAKLYQRFLELPHVGLALDPEWRLAPDQVHLRQIGQVGIDEVNQVVGWLADLTREQRLPQKLLVLHQFQLRMIVERERLDTSRDELAIMVHVDGQGGQVDKQATWAALHQNAPAPLYWGWKNFYDEDLPMLTPEQTIEQAVPTPELITYQ